jgi:hypothetical protein
MDMLESRVVCDTSFQGPDSVGRVVGEADVEAEVAPTEAAADGRPDALVGAAADEQPEKAASEAARTRASEAFSRAARGDGGGPPARLPIWRLCIGS